MNVTRPVPLPNDQAGNVPPVVASAIASGGLVGAGLALLALQLPASWQPIALAIVPTLSSSCAIVVRVIALNIRRKHSRKQWEDDRENIIAYVDTQLPACQRGLQELENEQARQFLHKGIERLQRIKAAALSALPGERPWLTELEIVAAIDLPKLPANNQTSSSVGPSLDGVPA